METRFNQLSLRARLACGIGAVIVLMFVANIVAVHAELLATRESLRAGERHALAWMLAAGAVGIALALLAARLLVGNIRRSVEAGVRFADELAAGNFDARLPVKNARCELGGLYAALNSMADRLQATHDREYVQHAELLRTNRSLRMVSRCHEALVRAATPEELCAAVCRSMVEEGGYPLAWTGAQGNGGELLGGAIHGSAEGRYAAAAGGWRSGSGIAGVGLDALLGGGQRLQRGEYGFASALALPLRTGALEGQAGGVLCVYAADPAAFDAAEVALLQELADDLAFGLNSMREARKRRAAEQALAYQANHDPATGLANRTQFNDRLRQAMVAAERNGRKVGVLAISMDRYRGVKVGLGHDACNALLMHVAMAMKECLREGDTLARLLGNEFAVIVPDMAQDEDVLQVALKLLNAVKLPMRWQDNIVNTTASIGIALMSKDGNDASGILRSANAAMAHALGLGGNRFRFYAPEMNERTSRMFAMEAELRRAINQQELVLHYQPRAAMAGASLAGAEALVRWQHPTRGLVPPGEFIALAENSGLIVPLGAWVIREVCRQQRAWREAGLPLVPVAVNLSPRQFREDGLVEHIEVALQENGVPPALLGFEITESMVMEDLDDAVAKLNELKAIGIKLALDDFGTGHSSLARLRELPVDFLKIDQTFVRQLGSEPADEAVCRSIIDLGHNLNMHIVAEGVETLLQQEWLRAHHCDEIQGYFYARPMPAAAFAELLAAEPPRSNTMLPLWRAINNKG
ncbi:MAG: hypothetical protein K0R43_1517 [Pseudoduganella sp.]|jgi:diguanylate cyclase (GGDEF)-like protein|nr:hypothetical protein [Pseudoduganella sp.]